MPLFYAPWVACVYFTGLHLDARTLEEKQANLRTWISDDLRYVEGRADVDDARVWHL